jgi:hypothetical protein
MCCGSGGPKKIRSTYSKQAKGVIKPQRAAKAVSPRRQRVAAKRYCDKCGGIALLVYIAGRERFQCSKDECRNILK